MTSSTEKLLQRGAHNTWEEIAEAHKVSQIERLKLTEAGRATLRRLNYADRIEAKDEKGIMFHLRELITVAAIPRNMHLEHHGGGRRVAREKALKKAYGKDE